MKAMQNGHWIILDELNLAPSDVLEALNRVSIHCCFLAYTCVSRYIRYDSTDVVSALMLLIGCQGRQAACNNCQRDIWGTWPKNKPFIQNYETKEMRVSTFVNMRMMFLYNAE